MLLIMGGIASKLFRLQFCRANVYFVLNLTHDTNGVQFSSVQNFICAFGWLRRAVT